MSAALLLATALAAVPALDQAKKLLDEFRMQEALAVLERAKSEGPYLWAEHVRLEELLGIAYAYLGRADDAQAAFERVLALDPRHAVSYTLSPKVTFVFERARENWETRPRPALEVSWPAELAVNEPIPIDVEVVSDPSSFFSKATLYYRARDGDGEFSAMGISLAPAGERTPVIIPPISASKDTTLEIYLTARNSRGDEVHRWYSEKEPRDLLLRHVPPRAWYGTWWVWVAIGGAVAAASVGTALAVTHEPDRNIDGVFRAQ